MSGSNVVPSATIQQALIARTFPQRLGIFVDVQNMFYSAKLLHQSKIDYGRLLREITGTRHLIRAIAYIVQKPDVNQNGFHEALNRFGYELKIKDLKIRPDADGRGGNSVKGSWEIGLTLDAMNMAPKLDCVTLVTGDGDYVPLVECLKCKGCRVEVVSFERSTASELVKAADQYIPIQEAWIFKEKKFDGSISSGMMQSVSTSGSGMYDGVSIGDGADERERNMGLLLSGNGHDGHARYSDASGDDDDTQPPNVHHDGNSRNRAGQ